MNGWLFGIGCWLGFNALVLLFAWASCRRRVDRFADWVEWEAELAREAAMRRHPAGRRRDLS